MNHGVKKIAIVGAGYMGKEHAKAFTQSPAWNVVGIVSNTFERAQTVAEEFAIPLVARSIKELYEKTEADAVVIAVPELAAREVILDALQYPWVTFLEKPPGYLPRIAEELLSEAQRLNRESYVALNRRFYGSTESVLQGLANDSGERVVLMQDQEDPALALSVGQPKEVVDAWMYANSIHVIDYALLLCRGAIEEVNTVQPYIPSKPCVVQSVIKFSSGDSATYLGLWGLPGPWSVQVCTESTRWELRPLEQLQVQRRGERTLTPVPMSDWDKQCKPGLRAMADELGKALRKEPHRLPTLQEGVQGMKLIQRIFNTN